MKNLSLCPSCHCMTKTIKGFCGKCKKKKKEDLLYYSGKETHDAFMKDTEERTIKQVIKYLEDRGYKVTKKTETKGFTHQEVKDEAN